MSESRAGLAAVEHTLVDLERALLRDASHVVVTGRSGPERSLLLSALPARLAGRARAAVIGLRGAEGHVLDARILRRLGREPGGDPQVRLLEQLRELAADGSALALLVEDAGSLSPAAVAHLGRLAAAAGPGLRLALFVDEAGADPVPQLVSRLGLGVQKIAAGGAAARSAPRRGRPPPPAGPRATVWVERGRLEPRGRPAVKALLGAGLLLLALLALPERLEERARPDSRRVAEPARQASLPPPAAAAAPVAPEPPAVAAAPPAPAIAAEPAPSPPLSRVSVNLNARPWARIEVDGRELGITPLGGIPLARGPHLFRARFADGRVLERRVTVDARHNRITFP